MTPWFLLLISACLVYAKSNATIIDAENGTCPPPNIPGFFYRDNCTLICQNSTSADVLVFYLGNYFAHAGTILTKPGQSLLTTVLTIINGIVLPGAGMLRGLDAILSFPKRGKTNLQVAARAGALCAIVKEDPEGGEGLERGPLQSRSGTYLAALLTRKSH